MRGGTSCGEAAHPSPFHYREFDLVRTAKGALQGDPALDGGQDRLAHPREVLHHIVIGKTQDLETAAGPDALRAVSRACSAAVPCVAPSTSTTRPAARQAKSATNRSIGHCRRNLNPLRPRLRNARQSLASAAVWLRRRARARPLLSFIRAPANSPPSIWHGSARGWPNTIEEMGFVGKDVATSERSHPSPGRLTQTRPLPDGRGDAIGRPLVNVVRNKNARRPPRTSPDNATRPPLPCGRGLWG